MSVVQSKHNEAFGRASPSLFSQWGWWLVLVCPESWRWNFGLGVYGSAWGMGLFLFLIMWESFRDPSHLQYASANASTAVCVRTLTRGQRSFPNDVVMSPVRGFHACAIALSLPLFFFQYRSISLSLCLSIYLSALLSPLSQHGDIGATIQQWSQRGGFMQLSHWLYIRASEQFVNLWKVMFQIRTWRAATVLPEYLRHGDVEYIVVLAEAIL